MSVLRNESLICPPDKLSPRLGLNCQLQLSHLDNIEKMDKPREYHGNLVAFEGNPDTVFTQLQLLPPSSQFLALPNVQSYLKDKGISSKPFNSRSYIRQIHEATQLRHKAATDFLEEATPDSKRLVFLCGGAASAVAHCITAISEHETQGDMNRAETLFRDITRHGLGPLMKDDVSLADETITPIQDEEPKDEDEATRENAVPEDPIIAAMKAADALDRETANLQPLNDLDFSVLSRPRSMSVPAFGYSRGFSRQSAISILGATQASPSADIPPALGAPDIEESDNVHVGNDEGDECNPQSPDDSLNMGGLFPPPTKPRANREVDAYEMATPDSIRVPSLGSPMSDASLSPPATPTGVVFGEARVIKMRVSRTEGDLTRTRSLDDLSMYGKTSRMSDPMKAGMTSAKHNLNGNGRPFSTIGLENVNGGLRPQSNLFAIGEGTVLKASKTLVRRSPTVLNRIRQLARSNYVDRGTDAESSGINSSDKPADVEEQEFIPVFPLLENLIVHFIDDGSEGLLDSVVQAYKDGTYPISRNSPAAKVKKGETPKEAADTSDASLTSPAPSIQVTQIVDEQVSAPSNHLEYDPYASHGDYGTITPKASQHRISVSSQTDKTYGQTKPSLYLQQPLLEPEPKFHYFSIAGLETVVSIQDALRSVLAVYFPCKEQGYHRYTFWLSSEMDNPWQPTFGRPAAPAPRAQPRRMDEFRRGCNRTDLILALGAQKGVKKEFIWKVGEELEALGTRPDGYTRSARLELK